MRFKLIFLSIKNAITEFKRVYLLMIISQFIAVLCIFFSYGIYGTYSAKLKELNAEDYLFWAEFSDGTVGNVKDILPEILSEMEDKMDFVLVMGRSDIGTVKMHSEYHNGKYYNSKSISDNVRAEAGRFLTDADMLDEKKVAFYHGTIEIDRNIEIEGVEFEIIGTRNHSALTHWTIPFTSCPESVSVTNVIIQFSELPTEKDYVLFKEILTERYGDSVSIDEFEFKDNTEQVSIRTIIIISIAIGVASALNICLLYGYIISKRKKQMAVYGIVGASKKMCFIVNELEIMFVCCAIELFGFVIFRFGLQRIFVNVYETGAVLYNGKSYAVMMAVYTGCVLVITSTMVKFTNRKNPADMLRGL